MMHKTDMGLENVGMEKVYSVGYILWVQKRAEALIAKAHIKSDEMAAEDWVNAWRDNPHFGQSKEPSPLALEFFNLLGAGKVVLEIGCGNGRDAIYLDSMGCKVTAIDIVPEAIRIARSSDAGGNVRFEVGDAEKLPYEEGSFDGVYSLSVLHTTDMARSIREVARVLRRGGVFFAYLYRVTRYTKPIGGERVEVNFDKGELERLLNAYFVKKDSWEFKVDDEDHTHNVVVYSMVKR